MSDYKIISKTEDASKERVFYTIEIAPFRFVDVMCIRNTSENYEYLIQNEDASYVYYELEYKYTYPGYPFDERKCLNLAAAQYAKDYYAKESIWDEIRSDYYDDEKEAWAIDAWKNCDRIYTGSTSWIHGGYHCGADCVVCYGDSADRADFPDAGAEADKPFLTLFIRLC